MNAQDLIEYWKVGSDDAWKTAEILFNNKKYSHSLFFCHLAVEKIIKGLIAGKSEQDIPPIHNLVTLTELTGLQLNIKQQEELKEMTSWNVRARYDEIKFSFYKKATEEYTKLWFAKAKEYLLWFKKHY